MLNFQKIKLRLKKKKLEFSYYTIIIEICISESYKSIIKSPEDNKQKKIMNGKISLLNES